MPHTVSDSTDKDINDVFSDILLSEELLNKKGYEEGYGIGTLNGNIEGYHLGYHRGAEIGAELGYYLGVVENHLKSIKNKQANDKKFKHLIALQHLIETYPKHNSETVDILKLLDDIRSQFRKVCSLLKVNASYPESSKVTF
ncbi:hypothetical protein PPYR_04968 [Photinus pyralis]|uniref:Essential protein Yae1 N-terminal domain-containing protein n=1 Tax=Photinus pyralis TaxID=7054 RepID=A0A1Y1NGQ2_PHOPY|nr:protein LTO1 homolog [Photinus pyralis]KAB0802782.1 hypothetical protein PPYR_04968 [Photinus pyralis]